jgi:anti-sigma B factor antagonist
MNFDITIEEKYIIVKCNVEKLDTNQAPDLKSQLVFHNKNGVRNMIIDLSGTRYCDSSGLSALLVANRLCKGNEGTFVLTGLQEPVQKLINISQLHTVLNITPSLTEAIDLLMMEEVERDLNKEG